MHHKNERKCLSCEKPLEGRIDKLYCDAHCKSAYQYRNKKQQPESLFKKIDKQLKLNRRILKSYNKAGKAVVRKTVLLQAGFNPKYFTNYWKNAKGELYLFCYEYGFLAKSEYAKDKYVLVQWQSFME